MIAHLILNVILTLVMVQFIPVQTKLHIVMVAG